jgi:hypothetical protein
MEEVMAEEELKLMVSFDGDVPRVTKAGEEHTERSDFRVAPGGTVEWSAAADETFQVIFAGGESQPIEEHPAAYQSYRLGREQRILIRARRLTGKEPLECKYTLIVRGVPLDPYIYIDPN